MFFLVPHWFLPPPCPLFPHSSVQSSVCAPRSVLLVRACKFCIFIKPFLLTILLPSSCLHFGTAPVSQIMTLGVVMNSDHNLQNYIKTVTKSFYHLKKFPALKV
ncbi:hypothetical protein CHARACLAT_033689 [Characodon lateralis]|uniref:Uncharacterized protein n=1 Tax=Characodon lateralis TaxID=208331 RepID=A0ABU7EJ01_9TELE|nr:hypothetical protein [Characodon lateralis]